MTLNFTALLLALFGLSFLLITLSLWLLRDRATSLYQGYSTPARFFLIALRLAIGWHCFVEGMEKFSSPNWSSEVYLRESMGPAAGFFHAIAGDRLVEKLSVGANDTFPAQLDREWRDYLADFETFYGLDQDQLRRAEGILEQREKDTLTYLVSKKEEVTKIAPYPPDLKLNMTMHERLEEENRLEEKVQAAEAMFPSNDKDVLKQWKDAKADLGKWRTELKKSLAAETAKMKKALEDVLTSEQKQQGPMTETRRWPKSSWRLLEWSDFAVQWGLIVLGGCLLLGFLSRPASLLTALLILSFYVAMPPLPGWPESPRLEGHYLLINKTLIEVVALLALTFIPTGRWAGIDGLLQFLFPQRREVVRTVPLARPIATPGTPVVAE